MELVLAIVYWGAGWWAYGFLRRHLLKITHEYTTDIIRFYMMKCVWVLMLTPLMVPVALVLKLFGVGRR